MANIRYFTKFSAVIWPFVLLYLAAE